MFKSKLTKLYRSELGGGAGVYLAANIINGLIPFIMLPVLTRYLMPSEYGVLAIFQVWCSLLGAICGLNVTGAALRKYYDYSNPDTEIKNFISACLMILILTTVTTVLTLIPLSGFIEDVISLSSEWIFLGVIVAFFNFLIQIRLGQWQVRKSSFRYGMFQISRTTLNIILSLCLVILLGMGVDGRLIGVAAASVIFGIVAIYILQKDGFVALTWQPKLMQEALAYGIPMMPHIIGTFLLTSIDRALISNLVGLDSAGYYMVAFQFSLVLSIVLRSFHQAFTPWLYERLAKKNDLEQLKIKKVKRYYFYAMIFVVAITFLLGDTIVLVITGPNYQAASDIVAWMILAQAFRGLYGIESGFIVYAKKNKSLAKITIFCGLLHVVLVFTLVPYLGITGAAYSFCISSLSQWLITRKIVIGSFGNDLRLT